MDSLLDRFTRYVKVETTANENTTDYPSSPGQLELGRMLTAELRQLGLSDAAQDPHGIIMATIPGTVAAAPTIAWLAHVDTSPEYTARNVKPVIHRDYDGRDITLPGDPSKVIRLEDSPHLAQCKGKTVITTDGTTLLGADDKAGVAIIMTAAAALLANRNRRTGPIRIVFTCDEEIGRGTDKLDLKKIAATCAYTLDGESPGSLENETFSADLATITIQGRNIHPGLATGRMINAIRLAGQLITRLPWRRLAPESTAGRDGFLHPYVLEGGVDRVKIKVLLRSFETPELATQAELLRQIAATVEAEHAGATVEVAVTKQYRNMAEALSRERRAVKLAAEAYRKVGLEPRYESIRGGTDGSRLSEMGLPTPNLFTGMHNFHSPLEYAVLEEMEQSVQMLLALAELWGGEKG